MVVVKSNGKTVVYCDFMTYYFGKYGAIMKVCLLIGNTNIQKLGYIILLYFLSSSV